MRSGRGMVPPCALALWLAAGLAHAGNAQLQQARDKLKDLDYQAMQTLLAEALLQPDIKREEYQEIYKLQGFTYTALGEAPKAREAFVKVLVIDPTFELEPKDSPRFRTVFNEVKKDFQKRGEVSLTHVPATVPGAGEGLDVEVVLKDAFGRVNTARSRVRAVVCTREGAYVDVQLQGAASKEGERTFKGKLPDPAATIPGDKPRGYFLDYLFEFQNVVGDKVEVQGGKPTYRVTVGDPDAAAQVCKAPAASSSEQGGGFPVLPVLLAAGLAGGGVVTLVLLLAGGSTVAGVGGVAAYCLETGCGTTDTNQKGKVQVTVTHGSTP